MTILSEPWDIIKKNHGDIPIKNLTYTALIALTATLIISCGGDSSPSPTTQITPPSSPTLTSPLAFAEVSNSRGISHKSEFSSGLDKDPRYFAGGGAAGDIDNDGDIDLFITRGDTLPNLLFINDGRGNFSDQASSAGLAFPRGNTANYKLSGPSLADLDGDNDLDLFIGGVDGDPALLFKNNGNGTFTDVTATSGLSAMTSLNTISSALGDYDRDGDLDLVLAHWGTPRDSSDPGSTETLWRNDSDSSVVKFTDVSESSKLSEQMELNLRGVLGSNIDYTFSPNFADVNGDGWPDLLSVSDFNGSQIFINNQDGTFTDMTERTQISEGNGMGSAVGDYDNDGDLDWFVSSIDANGLYDNENGNFTSNLTSGTGLGGWGWGSCFADFDADGFLDIYQTNGWISAGGNPDEPYTEDISRLWISNGDKSFTRSETEANIVDTAQGRGVICADFDGDFDTDVLLLINNAEKGVYLFDNTISRKNTVSIKLQGIAPNTDAIGARIIVVTSDGKNQTREIRIGSNYTTHDPVQQVIGLGNATTIDTIRITWPDGKVTENNNVSANQSLTYTHPDL